MVGVSRTISISETGVCCYGERRELAEKGLTRMRQKADMSGQKWPIMAEKAKIE